MYSVGEFIQPTMGQSKCRVVVYIFWPFMINESMFWFLEICMCAIDWLKQACLAYKT